MLYPALGRDCAGLMARRASDARPIWQNPKVRGLPQRSSARVGVEYLPRAFHRYHSLRRLGWYVDPAAASHSWAFAAATAVAAPAVVVASAPVPVPDPDPDPDLCLAPGRP